jgi:hypothetical protein
MNAIYSKLSCPRDQIAFRAVWDAVPVSLSVIARVHDPSAELTLSRARYWRKAIIFGTPRSISFWGQQLRTLEIRTETDIDLSFIEFLPRLEHVSIAAGTISQTIMGTNKSLKTLKIVCLTLVSLPQKLETQLPALEELSVKGGTIFAIEGTRVSPTVHTIFFLGICTPSVMRIIETSRATRVSIIRSILIDMPSIPPTVRELDLSANHIENGWMDPETHSIRKLCMAGNSFLDPSTINGGSIEYVDVRGCRGEYPILQNVEHVIHSVAPVVDIVNRCPSVKRITVSPMRYPSTIGYEYNRLNGTKYVYTNEEGIEEYGCSGSDSDDLLDIDERWVSYIDDVMIVHSPTIEDLS